MIFTTVEQSDIMVSEALRCQSPLRLIFMAITTQLDRLTENNGNDLFILKDRFVLDPFNAIYLKKQDDDFFHSYMGY